LQLYVDAAGRSGVEYPTDAGVIDILATTGERQFVVFELKPDRGPDRALGQLARYMGWVRLTFPDAHGVSGVLVARTINDRLRYAAAVMPNVSPMEYEVRFEVRPTRPLAASPIRRHGLVRKHFGTASVDNPRGLDNEQIDAGLAREYGDTHKAG
jgi:hypothetical protein